ncbi:serine hydrolase [Methylobacterium sp. NEAU 140]|uniref:serine hydrolase domain-containing protein n=1 Tax=Methylobacterium sp. NEAU 140 TaxID=3064945 RepID=UPI002736B95C|nr:serine hydrolase [Methylobacterium sp. NEAU 140]MDP4025213.1 serine hydrolase [Methylobacterium sp. NEAU 140]
MLSSALALGLALAAGLAAAGLAAAQDGVERGGPRTAAPIATAVGEDADFLKPIIDRIVGGAVAREAIPGAIVGVSWQGRRSYFGYSGTGAAPFTAETIVEIGSITKVFTTALFAEAVAEGRMQPDAPLQSYLPDRRLRPCTAQITPLQLADFTSGMPALPDDAPRALAERGIGTYAMDAFLAWVTRWAPEGAGNGGCDLPAPYRYSNASVGLLGYIVAERLGMPWEALVRERITGPLRMGSTAVSVPPAQRDRLAQGYGQNNRPVMPWPVFAWYAAGALRSDAADMLTFGEAALGHESAGGAAVPPPLSRALKTAMRPIYQPEGQAFRQGMAWIEAVGDPAAGQRPLFLKTGGTNGFNSVLVINPGKDLVVFLAANHPDSGAQRLGVAVSRQIRR